jgi:hypothetical protein
MNGTQERKTVRPPADYGWIENTDDIERLGKVHVKLEALADFFSVYTTEKIRAVPTPVMYGCWRIIEDIEAELAAVMKLDYWTGKAGGNTAGGAEPAS